MIKLAIFVLLAVSFARCFDDSLFINIAEPETKQEEVEQPVEFEIKSTNLCAEIKCELGEICVIEDYQARCDCFEACEQTVDERTKVCTNGNNTFESDCHLLREKCWCKRNDNKCSDKKVLDEKLDYYGQCTDIGMCSLEHRKVFPDRMKSWLDEVMHILNQREHIEPRFKDLVTMSDKLKLNNDQKYWIYGVAFEFCDLDKSHDHIIQKDELKELISSIKALENCITPFLDDCDQDKNEMISDYEWGRCLGLEDKEIDILRKYCN